MSYNNYNNNNNFHRRDHRINEDDVPESKHTIFVRGLPGNMSTEEVKDFFEDRIGPVSFDFVKQSPDMQRLFVAIRFETRAYAKEAMNKYTNDKILGCRCELSWFKDIRRFAQYQSVQGGGPSRGRQNQNFRRNNYNNRGYDRGGYRDRRDSEDRESRSRSRSRSRGSTRSRSRSRSNASSRRDSKSRSRERSSSPVRRDRSRESDRSRGELSPRARSDRNSSVEEERRKKKKEKKNKKKRSKRTHTRSRSSSRSSDEGEIRSGSDDDIAKLRDKAKNIHREPTATPITPLRESVSPDLVTARPASSTTTPLTINLKPRVEVPSVADAFKAENEVASNIKNTSISIGMEGDTVPRVINRLTSESRQNSSSQLTTNGINVTTNGKDKRSSPLPCLPPPPQPPSFDNSASPAKASVSANSGSFASRFKPIGSDDTEPPAKRDRLEDVPPPPPRPSQPAVVCIQSTTPPPSEAATKKIKPPSTPVSSQSESIPVTLNGSDTQRAAKNMSMAQNSARFPTTTNLFADLKQFQDKLVQGVKPDPPKIDDEESFSGFRLSSFTTGEEDNPEDEKRVVREQRLAGLDKTSMERYMLQKKKLETAMKRDMETFAFVTKRLLDKDPALETQLRLALIENFEDLEKQLLTKLDQFLDTIAP